MNVDPVQRELLIWDMKKWYIKEGLKGLSRHRFMTLPDLSEKTGISRSTFDRWKTEIEPSPDKLKLTASVLKMELGREENGDIYLYEVEENARQSSADWVDDVEAFYNPKKEQRRNHKKPCVKSIVNYANKLEQDQILELIKYIEYRYGVKEEIEVECSGGNNNPAMKNN